MGTHVRIKDIKIKKKLKKINLKKINYYNASLIIIKNRRNI